MEEKEQVQANSVSRCFAPQFFSGAIVGLIPHSLQNYSAVKEFKTSIVGNVWCVILMVIFAVNYHFATMELLKDDDRKGTGALSMAIVFLIVYMEPFMMVVDVIGGLLNQKTLISCIEQIRQIDESLKTVNIKTDANKLLRLGRILVSIVIVSEFVLTLATFLEFVNDYSWWGFYWSFNGFPMLVNAIGKIWFVTLIVATRQRFQAINKFLNDTAKTIQAKKRLSRRRKIPNIAEVEDLVNPIMRKSTTIIEKPMGVVKVVPFDETAMNVTKLAFVSTLVKEMQKEEMMDEEDYSVGNSLDKTLSHLCKVHDQICEVAKAINGMFGFQILIAMAYGFLSVTAQFYFLYCFLMEQELSAQNLKPPSCQNQQASTPTTKLIQFTVERRKRPSSPALDHNIIKWLTIFELPIPPLFRTAESVEISLFFIVYTTLKCIAITYVCWKTKTDARKTGVYLHKISHTADELHLYNLVNHLSLKLLNHQLSFTACGFFDLDMTTIYAICGAITSYLIILIQFNLAGVRTKKVPDNSTTTISPLDFTTVAGLSGNSVGQGARN